MFSKKTRKWFDWDTYFYTCKCDTKMTKKEIMLLEKFRLYAYVISSLIMLNISHFLQNVWLIILFVEYDLNIVRCCKPQSPENNYSVIYRHVFCKNLLNYLLFDRPHLPLNIRQRLNNTKDRKLFQGTHWYLSVAGTQGHPEEEWTADDVTEVSSASVDQVYRANGRRLHHDR